jgi:hypothetical protein
MAARRDPAAELAERMLHVLQAQRTLGPDAYPLTLRRLAELADPSATPEQIHNGAGKRRFKTGAIVLKPKDLDFPVALAEDADALAGSPLMLDYALAAACTPNSPVCETGKLKSKVPPRLRAAFDTALQRRVQEGTLAPDVALVTLKKKQYLHLKRYPLPKAPEEALADDLVQVLQAQRARGGDGYPIPLNVLLERARPGAGATLVKKALAQPAFQQHVILADRRRTIPPDTLAALTGDEALLAASPALLERALRASRTASQPAHTVAEIGKKISHLLVSAFAEAVTERIAARTLPAGIGCLVQKHKPLLFLLEDLVTGAASPRPAPQQQPASTDFAQRFDEAFRQLEQQARVANFISLVELRRSLPCDRGTFDAGLHQLRLAGRYSLSAAEGRYGISPAEQEAGIREDGALLLYVSRRSP